jgi:hypothetical protein
MRKIIQLAFLFSFCSLCWADGIPPGDYLYINSSGGSVQMFSTGEISGEGIPAGGGTFSFYGRGHAGSGALYVSDATFFLDGQLSKVFFNKKTGLFQGSFTGVFREDGQTIHLYHSVFYESVNMKTRTLNSGWLVYSTAPEPDSIWLGLTGLLAVGAAWWRRVRT